MVRAEILRSLYSNILDLKILVLVGTFKFPCMLGRHNWTDRGANETNITLSRGGVDQRLGDDDVQC
jgi:hypothetical protein